jgi:hypothetical protein
VASFRLSYLILLLLAPGGPGLLEPDDVRLLIFIPAYQVTVAVAFAASKINLLKTLKLCRKPETRCMFARRLEHPKKPKNRKKRKTETRCLLVCCPLQN